MRSFNVLVAWALCVNLIAGTPAMAAETPVPVAPVAAGTGWIAAPCTESATVPSRPLPPRPALRRRTFASPLPHRPLRRRAHATRVAHVVRKPVHRTAPRHPRFARRHSVAAVPQRTALNNLRPAVRRVTFASPICEDRAPAINALLGLPETPVIDQPLVESALQDVLAPQDQPLLGVPVAGYGEGVSGPGGGSTDSVLPSAPAFSTGGIGGGGTAVGIPVSMPSVGTGGGVLPGSPAISVPPNAISAVPEPATWAIMFVGFGFVGGAMRRRRTLPLAA